MKLHCSEEENHNQVNVIIAHFTNYKIDSLLYQEMKLCSNLDYVLFHKPLANFQTNPFIIL